MSKFIVSVILLIMPCILLSQNQTSGWIDNGGYLEQKLKVGPVDFIKFSTDGKFIFTFGKDTTLRKWDLKTGELLREKHFDPLFENPESSFDDKFELIASSDVYSDNKTFVISLLNLSYHSWWYIPYNSALFACLYDLEKDSIIAVPQLPHSYDDQEHIANIKSVIDQKTGNIYYELGYKPSYQKHDYSTGGMIYAFDSLGNYINDYGTGFITDMDISLRNSYLGYCLDIGSFYIYDLAKNKYILYGADTVTFSSISFDRDSKFCAISSDNNLMVWDCTNWQLVQYRENIFNSDVIDLCYSIDNRSMISTDKYGINFYDANTFKFIDNIPVPCKEKFELALSPDSQTFAVGSDEGVIRLYKKDFPQKANPDIVKKDLHVNIFPNPFYGSSTIAYTLERATMVKLSIYNSLGGLVQSVIEEWQQAGEHQYRFSGEGLSQGIYFYKLDAGGEKRTGNLVLVK